MNAEQVAQRLTRGAWSALGADPGGVETVTFAGRWRGLLPSTFAALPAMAAAIAVSTSAAATLDASRRSARPAPVVVDVEHVAVAARSERYARAGDAPPGDLFAPLSRFFRSADGWVRLHMNYPWHRQRALTVLGCSDSPEDVARAVRDWPGEALEDALAGVGALGSAVRDRRRWEDHPQGRAVGELPLLQVRPGTGRPRTTTPARGASGMRVLDLTRVIAGPVATRTLAGWGAEVLRLDPPGLPEIAAQALDTLPGKRSAALDLGGRDGRARLEELLSQADLLVLGYRPGALARHGLGVDEVMRRHPHLNVVSLSAWGPTGPWSQRRGFDSLVQCGTGIAAAEGDDEAPGALPAQVLDHATGYLAAAAGMLALARVQRGGPPSAIQLSLAQTAHWLWSGGRVPIEPERDTAPERYLVTLPGTSGPVRVVGPPGAVDDLRPRWASTDDLGASEPAFHPPQRGDAGSRAAGLDPRGGARP